VAVRLAAAQRVEAQQQQRRPQQAAPLQETLAAAVDREMRGCVGTVSGIQRHQDCLDLRNAALEQRLNQALARLQAAMEPPERRVAFGKLRAAWGAYRRRHRDPSRSIRRRRRGKGCGGRRGGPRAGRARLRRRHPQRAARSIGTICGDDPT
jgi:hypothetical protein